jgi:DNA-binding IclR family transcriptional regulator
MTPPRSRVASPDTLKTAATQRGVQSVEVGGRLLLALGAAPGPLVLKELAAAAGMAASKAHPYLVSFARLGLVEQISSGLYALGPAALQLGLTGLLQSDPLRAATPVAEALAQQTGHAVALAVWGNFGPTVVRLFEARQPLHATLRAGSVMGLFGTATGRAFVAALPRHRIEETLAGPAGVQALHSTVGGTPVGTPVGTLGGTPSGSSKQRAAWIKSASEEATAEWQRHGLVRAVGQPLPGVNAFSAPVLDHQGQAVLVMTLLGVAAQFASAWQGAPAQALRQAAAQVQARLGHGAAAKHR